MTLVEDEPLLFLSDNLSEVNDVLEHSMCVQIGTYLKHSSHLVSFIVSPPHTLQCSFPSIKMNPFHMVDVLKSFNRPSQNISQWTSQPDTLIHIRLKMYFHQPFFTHISNNESLYILTIVFVILDF